VRMLLTVWDVYSIYAYVTLLLV